MKISELIKQLEHIKINYGNLNVYKWGDGFPKIINSIEVMDTFDNKKAVLLGTI